jgi:nicotinamide riboside transporter PnuC
MDPKKGINLSLAIIAVILGITLLKHIDFKNFTLKKPVLDSVYFVMLAVCIYLIVRDCKKSPEK